MLALGFFKSRLYSGVFVEGILNPTIKVKVNELLSNVSRRQRFTRFCVGQRAVDTKAWDVVRGNSYKEVRATVRAIIGANDYGEKSGVDETFMEQEEGAGAGAALHFRKWTVSMCFTAQARWTGARLAPWAR